MTANVALTGCDWIALLRGQPTPTRYLYNVYHPSISPDHPCFGKLPPREQVLVEALHRQYERWNYKPYI